MADIRHSIQISAPAAAVYPVVSSEKGWAQWWAADVTESGDVIELGFFNRATVYRLKAQVNRQNAYSEWLCETGKEWEGTRIVFQLEPAANGTLLRFSHAGWKVDTDYFVSCNTTWGELMFRLKAAVEGRARGPLFLPDSMAY
jgi:uncharacterized protein YndB with AHSA1/START domain